MTSLRMALAAALATFAVGCSGSGSPTGPNQPTAGTSGGASSSTGSSSGSAGTSGSTSSGGSSGSTTGTTGASEVFLVYASSNRYTDANGTARQSSYGSVDSYSPTANPLNCSARQSFGACTRQDCPYPFPTTQAAPRLNAGHVAIAGAGASITFDYQPDGGYPTSNSQSALWSGGETFTATGGGGPDVPGFTLTDTAPTAGTLSAPTFSSGASGTGFQPFSISSDLTVSWSGVTADEVDVYLGGESTTTYSMVSCTAPASAGTLTIPAAAMAGMAGINGVFDVTAVSRSSEVQQGVEVDFQLGSFVHLPSGREASVGVAMQ